ncbi:MAG TPA: TIM barrel protein [Longimicrobiales bacterium]|nr:TIM barrel protein [Longimicrobiales bacterium]
MPESSDRIRHAITTWPYMLFGERWDLDTLCQVACDLGCVGLDLAGPEHWPTMAKYGLISVLSPNGMPDPPFMKGLNNPKYHDEVIARTLRRIDECAQAGVPAVIAFTGFGYRDAEDPNSGEIPPDEGAANTIRGLQLVALEAERKGVTIVLEHLNTRVSGDDWRGHPGYQGDDIDYCADIIRAVGSPRVKLLFDVYHVQIMNGDVISRIREYGNDLIGHVHVAGVPGRRELDDGQELRFGPIMQALVDIGYEGYVGQEFIPTKDPREGLREAIEACSVHATV